VEGINPWIVIAVYALFGLMALSLVPALAAVALLLIYKFEGFTDEERAATKERVRKQALRLFAAALLCEALVWAAFCIVLEWPHLRLLNGLIALSLLLAGSGQFVAAVRSPRTYAVALGFAAGAVVVLVAGTSIQFGYGVLNRHDLAPEWLPPEWLYRLPDWKSLPMAVTSLILAGASLVVAVLDPFTSRPLDAEGAEGKGPARTND